MSLVNGAYDCVVVGSGPNGLAGAIRLAQKKLSVLLLEADETLGGGIRSKELTLPGFSHDVCSAIHPLGLGSPFFRTLGLERFGLTWIQPEVPVANPLAHGGVAALFRSLRVTAEQFGPDARAYQRLFSPLVAHWEHLAEEFLQPMPHLPRHPFELAGFGLRAMRSGAGLARASFKTEPPRVLFAGLAAHSFLSLEAMPSAAFGLVLGMMGHAVGWPLPQGGAGRITAALAALFQSLGGKIQTGCRVENLDQLPRSRVVLLDIGPRQLLRLAAKKLPAHYRRRLESFHYGPGIFKIDYALSAPIPWKDDVSSRAGTVHIGGSFAEIAAAEDAACQGQIAERPFILLTQPTQFDPSRAPAGKHIAWAYCHVPNGSTVDMTERMERQIERFAPGFRGVILARNTMNCTQLERMNPNLVGGDINGGSANLWQLLARPILSPNPYRTPLEGVYLCSASTPPGGGVHGMCGFHAAEIAWRDHFS